MIDEIKKLLVVAPHPDDELLGCAGTIKRLTEKGAEVWVLILSRGKKGIYSEDRIRNVRKEAIEAHNLLGVKITKFFDYSAPELDLVSVSTLSRAISEVVQQFRPDAVFLPHRGDLHHDHKAVYNAGLVAVRPNGDYLIKKVFSYETLSETEWAAPFSDDAFVPDFFVNISESVNAKMEAIKCYKSQLREFPNSRSLEAIEALAKFRGSTVRINRAEAFMTIRIIED
jgi:LmbE family N-acetylglucosaminyl deacetylase